MKDLPLIAAIVNSGVTFIILYKPFFGDQDDLWECVGCSFKPDLFSLLDGSFAHDFGKSAKLGTYIALCMGAGALTYAGVEALINS